MALVFLGLRARGLYFLPLENFLRFSFYVWLMTVRTLAMDLRTTQILDSLEAAPPVTLATRSWDSSFFRSSSCFSSSSFFLPLRSLALILAMMVLAALLESPMYSALI